MTPTTDQSASDRLAVPGTNYKRRTVPLGTSNRSGYPLRGTGVQSGSAPVTVSAPPSYRITTPVGQRRLPARDYNNFVYNAPVTYVGGPTLLGGYYYGNYCEVRYDSNCYPSVFGAYYGMPQFIYNPGVVIVSEPYYPVYTTTYLPFYVPVYQTTYNENNYYVGSEDRVQELQQGGAPAQEALKNAYPADSFQAAFADIEKAWQNNDITLIDRHLRDKDTKLSVFVDTKYSYSLASGDFLQITRDAFDRLKTVSFNFTRLRKAKNGDVTAFGKHIYHAADGSPAAADNARVGDTVPFSTDGSQPAAKSDASAAGAEKTMYVSYTLTHHDTGWYIIAVDSSPNDLVK